MARRGAARTTVAVEERGRQNGAEIGRRRILDLLDQDGPHGVEWLRVECHMSHRTINQRLRELADLVRVGEDDHGNRMAGLR